MIYRIYRFILRIYTIIYCSIKHGIMIGKNVIIQPSSCITAKYVGGGKNW